MSPPNCGVSLKYDIDKKLRKKTNVNHRATTDSAFNI